jgi:hypothetical protein
MPTLSTGHHQGGGGVPSNNSLWVTPSGAVVTFGGQLVAPPPRTFSDRFNDRFLQQKNWDMYPEARKMWSDQAIEHYSRYGIGLSTFVTGLVVLGTLLDKYF